MEINSPDAMDLMLKIQVLDAHSFPNQLVWTEMRSILSDLRMFHQFKAFDIELNRKGMYDGMEIRGDCSVVMSDIQWRGGTGL